jgi:hypothetical protein
MVWENNSTVWYSGVYTVMYYRLSKATTYANPTSKHGLIFTRTALCHKDRPFLNSLSLATYLSQSWETNKNNTLLLLHS